MQHVAIADQTDELHDPQSFITRYIWSQDHKVIAIQYGLTAIFVGLATDDGTASTAPPVVPLPAGLPLLLTGFAAFAGLRSRKRGRP